MQGLYIRNVYRRLGDSFRYHNGCVIRLWVLRWRYHFLSELAGAVFGVAVVVGLGVVMGSVVMGGWLAAWVSLVVAVLALLMM